MGAGCWDRPAESAETFSARLAADDGQRYLRTGNLAFLSGGQLFVTGRLKEIIIVMGRNQYPQDIEDSVARSHQSLRAGGGAAFTVDADGEQRLIVVQEVDRSQLRTVDPVEVGAVMRHTVAGHHPTMMRLGALAGRAGAKPLSETGGPP